MNKSYSILLVFTILALGGALIFAYTENNKNQSENEELLTLLAARDAQLAKRGQDIQALDAELDSLAAELDEIRESMAIEAETSDAPNLLQGLLDEVQAAFQTTDGEATDDEEPGDSPGGALAGMMESMFSDEGGEEMIEMSTSMAVNMQYGELFIELDLSPERKLEVQGIIKHYAAEKMRMGFSAMTGENIDDIGVPDHDALLREELSEILSPQELATFDAYEEEMPERMLRQSMEMQLTMLARGLTPDNREMVLDVIVEEVLLGTDMAEMLQNPGSINAEAMGAQMENQVLAYERALERLEPAMEPDQLEILAQFVEQQRMIARMASQMFEGIIPDTTGEAP